MGVPRLEIDLPSALIRRAPISCRTHPPVDRAQGPTFRTSKKYCFITIINNLHERASFACKYFDRVKVKDNLRIIITDLHKFVILVGKQLSEEETGTLSLAIALCHHGPERPGLVPPIGMLLGYDQDREPKCWATGERDRERGFCSHPAIT